MLLTRVGWCLDQLARMSAIADHITSAGRDRPHRRWYQLVFVTHLYDLASRLYRERLDTSLFLRADTGVGGERTFKLSEDGPSRPATHSTCTDIVGDRA